jgi:CMP-N-acetylneuraminic acid synthetase
MFPHALAFIPARGGSKGIPKKNIIELGGIPLISYSILQALNCPLIDRTIVSTDSNEIASMACKWGAEVPFLRDASLSHDEASIHDAMIYTLNALHLKERYTPDIVCILFPTSPFRPKGLVETVVRKSMEGYRLVRTVARCDEANLGVFDINDSGTLVPICQPEDVGLAYTCPLGSATGLHLQPTRETYLIEIDTPYALVDIDTWTDYNLAQNVVDSGLYSLEQELLCLY